MKTKEIIKLLQDKYNQIENSPVSLKIFWLIMIATTIVSATSINSIVTDFLKSIL